MKQMLLLSSTRLLIKKPSIFKDALGRSLKGLNVVYVINAVKGVSDHTYVERNKMFFNEQGCSCTELDLDAFNESKLRALLPRFDLVYVEGGNTFCLLKAIRESGFESVIKELLPQELIYMGASAGSYVACPSIEMATWKHQDKYDHCSVTDFTGMELVPFLITVHYQPELRELIKEKISQTKYPVRILTDEQALLVQDDKITLIGNDDEVIL